MKIEIEARNLSIDNEASQFVRTSVAFSTWRHEPEVQSVRVVLELGKDRRSSADRVTCDLFAHCSDGSWAHARSPGENLFEAVQEATNRLERELFRSAWTSPMRDAQLFAA